LLTPARQVDHASSQIAPLERALARHCGLAAPDAAQSPRDAV